MDEQNKKSTPAEERQKEISRRKLLLASMGIGMGIAGLSVLTVAGGLKPKVVVAPDNDPPQKGDLLVFAQGPKQGKVITVDEVPVDKTQIFAWPMDPKNNVIRNKRSLNIILLIRAQEESWFNSEYIRYAHERVVIYSATCTHLCCNVSEFVLKPFSIDKYGYLFCPCHKSHYDPWDGAKVLYGPAPRPLPILPFSINGGRQIVAEGAFLTYPGCS